MNRYPALEVRPHRASRWSSASSTRCRISSPKCRRCRSRRQGERQDRRRAARHGRGCAEGGQHRRIAARCSTPIGIKVRFADPDTQLKAKDVAAGEARRQLHRRAEPAVVVAALARVDRRAADVPRPRPARRRAFPAAGRHEGARSTRRPTATRPTSARCCARRRCIYSGVVARGPERRRCASATTPSARKARNEIDDRVSRPRSARAGRRRRRLRGSSRA